MTGQATSSLSSDTVHVTIQSPMKMEIHVKEIAKKSRKRNVREIIQFECLSIKLKLFFHQVSERNCCVHGDPGQ